MKRNVNLLEQEVKLLHDKNVLLEKSAHAKAWGYHKMAGSSEKVSYYTGLPNEEAFLWVVSVFAHSAQCAQRRLKPGGPGASCVDAAAPGHTPVLPGRLV